MPPANEVGSICDNENSPGPKQHRVAREVFIRATGSHRQMVPRPELPRAGRRGLGFVEVVPPLRLPHSFPRRLPKDFAGAQLNATTAPGYRHPNDSAAWALPALYQKRRPMLVKTLRRGKPLLGGQSSTSIPPSSR